MPEYDWKCDGCRTRVIVFRKFAQYDQPPADTELGEFGSDCVHSWGRVFDSHTSPQTHVKSYPSHMENYYGDGRHAVFGSHKAFKEFCDTEGLVPRAEAMDSSITSSQHGWQHGMLPEDRATPPGDAATARRLAEQVKWIDATGPVPQLTVHL